MLARADTESGRGEHPGVPAGVLTLRERHCYSTYADFILAGEDFDPETVTARLGLHEAGLGPQGLLVWAPRDGGFTPARDEWHVSSWTLSTGGLEELPDDTLERHLRVLLEVFESRGAALDRVRGELRLEAWFDCYWCASGFPAGPSLSADTMRRIAALDAHLALDFNATDEAPQGTVDDAVQ
jgi:hypothetical protein